MPLTVKTRSIVVRSSLSLSSYQIPYLYLSLLAQWMRKESRLTIIHAAISALPLALLWQFKGTFRGISIGYGFHIGKAKRRRHLWKRKNCQSSARAGMGVEQPVCVAFQDFFPLSLCMRIQPVKANRKVIGVTFQKANTSDTRSNAFTHSFQHYQVGCFVHVLLFRCWLDLAKRLKSPA